ncbi:unnamed protein product [Mesocestoides corti]|uniref:Uncharacterized protein n=1 Tax=Mesocestoides corti TaxID=53468 RepID=A0A0R3UJY2_MESCO|nr:unnamed protein product [Mesocestoides corti]
MYERPSMIVCQAVGADGRVAGQLCCGVSLNATLKFTRIQLRIPLRVASSSCYFSWLADSRLPPCPRGTPRDVTVSTTACKCASTPKDPSVIICGCFPSRNCGAVTQLCPTPTSLLMALTC